MSSLTDAELAELLHMKQLAADNPGDKYGDSNEEAAYKIAVFDKADDLLADAQELRSLRGETNRGEFITALRSRCEELERERDKYKLKSNSPPPSSLEEK